MDSILRVGAFVAATCLSAPVAGAQTVGTSGTADPLRAIWADPSPIGSRDLFWGIGAADRAPRGPFTFLEEKAGGTQPKIEVTDAQGVKWDVKFGPEAKAEVAANRLVHALGYFTEEIYLVPSGRIEGVPDLQRAGKYITSRGEFSNARFRRDDDALQATDEKWTFKENPFVASRELSGLLILMTMVNNWDIRGSANNEVLRVTTPGGRHELRYLVGDLGATFGRMGGRISNHSKWNVQDFEREGFIEKVENGTVHLDYDGFESGMDRVPLEHARWFAALVSELRPEQVRRAFEAAGATPAETEAFSRRFIDKIGQLQTAVKQPPVDR